ncbi:hypothetical protein J4558_22130 [Leptolyngbya sp. 15MV]|nr:hypothetical protein J4558_22130 [Leptolyngbya sp. 15MV]
MLDHTSRLRQFLSSRQLQPNFKQLTADAATREYFRILDNDHSVIACVYPEPFKIREQTYIEVTELFLAAGLPVAKILDVDELQGIILIEDLGDRILREELECSDETRRNELIDSSIRLIARIQAASQLAIERQSVVSRLKFDVEKLLWELNFFREHYFTTYRVLRGIPRRTEGRTGLGRQEPGGEDRAGQRHPDQQRKAVGERRGADQARPPWVPPSTTPGWLPLPEPRHGERQRDPDQAGQGEREQDATRRRAAVIQGAAAKAGVLPAEREGAVRQ